MKLSLATTSQKEEIWDILKAAIQRRKEDGSSQWQDGYPNPDTVTDDINSQSGFVLLDDERVMAYVAIKINDEPAYDDIVGEWQTNGDYIVIHRVAVAEAYLGKGMATQLFVSAEDFAKSKGIYSIKVDTNFDNLPMLHIFNKLDYQYCGKVYFSGAERKAFEKVLV